MQRDRQTDLETQTEKDIQADRQTDIETHRQRETYRQTVQNMNLNDGVSWSLLLGSNDWLRRTI
jgi:hypothetical protein